MSDASRPWLDNYDPSVPAHLDYENIPLYGLLEAAAERHPERPAIVFRNTRLSYRRLSQLTDVAAGSLHALGVRPGDRVAIMLPNLPQTIIAYWAALKAGAAVVMTNPLYMETELTHQLCDAGAETLITLDLLWPKYAALKNRLPVKRVIVTTIPQALSFPMNYLALAKLWREKKLASVPYKGTEVVRWPQIVRGKATFRHAGVSPDEDIALLQYTGGTTGVSKGCMLTHATLVANLTQCRSMLHTLGREPEVFLGILPYFHVYGLTVCLNFPTAIGATLVPFPRFEPADVLAAVNKVKPTVFPGAPSVYMALMQQKHFTDTDFASLKYCVSGSAAMPVEILRRFQEITGAEIIEGYGLTEASPVTHLNPLNGKRKPGTIGLPFPDTDARIVDMELGGIELPPGKVGELVIRGPQVMKGYWNRPDDTAQVLRNGWLYTGDIATMDEEGYFTIVDRKKDLIISAGYNIYPREIDEVLYQHPRIKEAVTVGIPHKTRGEVVKAFVVPKNGAKLDKAEIIAFCKEKLAAYKVPRQVEFRADLPKTLVGKVLRRALKEEELARERTERSRR